MCGWTLRSVVYALAGSLVLSACLITTPGCGGEEESADDRLAFDFDRPGIQTPKAQDLDTPAIDQSTELEQTPEPDPIRLTRADLKDTNKLMEIAGQCFPRLSRTQANWGREMTALAIAYRFSGQAEQYEVALEQALDRLGTQSYFLRPALRMLGKANCYDALEAFRQSVQDQPKAHKLAMLAIFESLETSDVAAYPALLNWCWADANQGTKAACWKVAENQIRLGDIDDAMKRLEDSKGKEYLRDDRIVQAIAVLAGQPDRAVPIAESLHNANGLKDQGRVWLVHAYTLLDEPAKAAGQLELIEGSPYRATARIVRHRIERSTGAEPTEDGESLAVELLPEIESPAGEPRNHLSYERAMLKNMLLDELMIYGREDLARPIFEERGIFSEGRVNSTSLDNAMGLYFRNNHPEIARGLFERLEDGTKTNKYHYVFTAFNSDPFLDETDLINLRPYLDAVFIESDRGISTAATRLRVMSYVINRAGLEEHEAWLSFIDQLDHEMSVMAVCIGTIESRLNLPGPRVQDIPWTGYPMPSR